MNKHVIAIALAVALVLVAAPTTARHQVKKTEHYDLAAQNGPIMVLRCLDDAVCVGGVEFDLGPEAGPAGAPVTIETTIDDDVGEDVWGWVMVDADGDGDYEPDEPRDQFCGTSDPLAFRLASFAGFDSSVQVLVGGPAIQALSSSDAWPEPHCPATGVGGTTGDVHLTLEHG